MATRDRFTTEEWQTLQFAPLWVFTAVAGIDNIIDREEAGALAKELSEAIRYKNPLAREVMSSVGADLQGVMQAYTADGRELLSGLGQVADLLDEKAPDQAEDFKKSMMMVGLNVARASGGGVFRDPVSNEEKVALAAVFKAMRTQLD